MSDKVILYCETVPEGFRDLVKSLFPPGFDLRFLFPGGTDKQGKIEDADYIIASIYKVTKDVIDRAKKCVFMATPGNGYDNYDYEYAREKGIYVTNAPNLNSTTTAEMTIALIMCCYRRICRIDYGCKHGEWHSWTWRHDSYEVLGKTIGIVGAGAVGKEVMKRLQGWGVKILYNDPIRMSPEMEEELHATYVDLNTLLKNADIVSLHCPLLPGTRGMIGKEQLEMMKKNAIIVNEARGAVIDNAALAEALENGDIWGAAIDCWEKEPLDPNDPLVHMDKVVTTSHLGAVSRETAERVFKCVFDNIVRVENGERPLHICNGL